MNSNGFSIQFQSKSPLSLLFEINVDQLTEHEILKVSGHNYAA